MSVAHRIICLVVATVIGLLATVRVDAAFAADHSEDAVKAAYLYRFAGYIAWPADTPGEAPFVIDVLGAPGIARELRRLLPDHPINGKVAQVRDIADQHDIGNAQVVYFAAGHAESIHSLSPESTGNSMLLVTDEEGGLRAGSALNFVTIDRNIRFEVSLTAAERWRLKISSELLAVAIRVQGRPSQSLLGCDPSGVFHRAGDACPSYVANRAPRLALPSATVNE